jgi:hypothetical protein
VCPAAAIFMDSVDTGAESQTTEHQAAIAQEVMDTHGGAYRLSAVATYVRIVHQDAEFLGCQVSMSCHSL